MPTLIPAAATGLPAANLLVLAAPNEAAAADALAAIVDNGPAARARALMDARRASARASRADISREGRS